MTLTSQRTLGMWLLRVLCDNNGRASKWLALRLMEEAYGHLLTEEDRELRVSVNECTWENNTAWERATLVEPDSYRRQSSPAAAYGQLRRSGATSPRASLPAGPTPGV